MEPTGRTITSSRSRDRVTFTLATGESPLVMVVRWKLAKPHFSRRLLSENCWRSVMLPFSSVSIWAPSTTAMR